MEATELNVRGDVSVLDMPKVAIAGARRCTPYGAAAAREMAAQAANLGYAVVTGGARGVETHAIKAALKAGGKCVVVLPSGLDKPYPSSNTALFDDVVEAGGCLVSEFPDGFPGLPASFRQRNGTIADMADIVVCCECGIPSGTFSLCDESHAAGTPVFAVPGSIFSAQSAGTNELISAGVAKILTSSPTLERAMAEARPDLIVSA